MSEAPIFIVGAPRSGTTLIAEMLNKNSSIFIFNETLFYDAFLKIGNFSSANSAKEKKYLINHLCSRIDARIADRSERKIRFGSRFTHKEAEEIKNGFINTMDSCNRDIKDSSELLSIFMKTVTKVKGKVHWGEKTPGHVFYLDSIIRDFPYAKIINIVRNPQDFLLSYKFAWRQRGGNFKNRNLYHPVVTSMLWKRSVDEVIRFTRGVSVERICTIRYEDLIKSPKGTMYRLFEFLHLQNSKDCSLVRGSNTSFLRTKESLSQAETFICWAICGKLAKNLGYIKPKVSITLSGILAIFVSLPKFIKNVLPLFRKRFSGSLSKYLAVRCCSSLRCYFSCQIRSSIHNYLKIF